MKSITPFLEYAQKRCGDYGVSLVLVPRRTTKFGDYGEFDDEKKRVVVCVNDPGWLTTLAHELGHMDQWIEGSAEWAAVRDYDYTDFDGLFAVIDRYLHDPIERESIRAFGHAEVHRCHTYLQRWRTILETLS